MSVKWAIGAALAGAAALGAILTAYVSAQPAEKAQAARTPPPGADTLFSDAEEDEIRALVREYLVENPEVILEAINAFQMRQRQAELAQLKSGAQRNLDTLLNGAGGVVVGADVAEAKVAVVEFFDYHCSHCKRANGLVREITERDPSVKFIFRELPILLDESDVAAEFALAAREQDKYVDLHFALMQANGVLTEKRIKDIARKTGVDVKALEAARRGKKVEASLKETRRIATEMGVNGTPAFVIVSVDGSFLEVASGFRPDEILDAIERAKKASS